MCRYATLLVIAVSVVTGQGCRGMTITIGHRASYSHSVCREVHVELYYVHWPMRSGTSNDYFTPESMSAPAENSSRGAVANIELHWTTKSRRGFTKIYISCRWESSPWFRMSPVLAASLESLGHMSSSVFYHKVYTGAPKRDSQRRWLKCLQYRWRFRGRF